jgi:hypothetical protein
MSHTTNPGDHSDCDVSPRVAAIIEADDYMRTVAPSEMRETRDLLPLVLCELCGSQTSEVMARLEQAVSKLRDAGVPVQGMRVFARMVFSIHDRIGQGEPVALGTGSLFDPFTVPVLSVIMGTLESRQPHWRVKVADFYLSEMVVLSENDTEAFGTSDAVQMVRAASAPRHDFPELTNGEVLMVVGLSEMARLVHDTENIADIPEPWLSDTVMCEFVRQYPTRRGMSRLQPVYQKAARR